MPLRSVRVLAASGDPALELQALRKEVVRLNQAVRARDGFIAIAGHELRNSMTLIQRCMEFVLTVARSGRGTCPRAHVRLQVPPNQPSGSVECLTNFETFSPARTAAGTVRRLGEHRPFLLTRELTKPVTEPKP